MGLKSQQQFIIQSDSQDAQLINHFFKMSQHHVIYGLNVAISTAKAKSQKL